MSRQQSNGCMKTFLLLVCTVVVFLDNAVWAVDLQNTQCDTEEAYFRATPTMKKADQAGDRKDTKGQIEYYKIGVKENNPWAKLMLSLYHGQGTDVPKNVTESFRLMSEAAAQDFGPSKTMMGLFYDLGRGVPQNYVEAVRWYKLAAAKGCAIAWFSLSDMHENGKGTPKSYIKAHMWANLYSAKDIGGYGKIRRDVLENIMTKEQIAQAQQLATRCQAQNFQNCD